MKKRFFSFLLVLLLLLPQQAKAQCFWSTSNKNFVIGCALVTAGVVGIGTYLLSRDRKGYNHQKREKGFFAAAVGFCAGLMGGYISYQTTPDSYLRSALNTFSSLERNRFFKIMETHNWHALENEFLQNDYHLYLMARKLGHMKQKLNTLLYYFNKAFKGLSDQQLPTNVSQLEQQAKNELYFVNELLRQTKTHPDYKVHARAYKKRQEKLEKLRIQQQRANAETSKANARWSEVVHGKHIHHHHHGASMHDGTRNFY